MTNPKNLLVPTTPQQDGIWFHSILNSASYWNFISVKSFKGILDISVLRKALVCIVKKHSSLRTNFRLNEKKIFQCIHDEVDIDNCFRVESFDHGAKDKLEETIQNEIAQYLNHEFNLEKEILFQFKVYQSGELNYFVLVINHIIADAVSAQIFWDDIIECYNLVLNNKTSDFSHTERQYYEFSIEQNAFFKTSEFEIKKSYWKSKITEKFPRLLLPFYEDLSLASSFVKETLFTSDLTEKIRSFALQNKFVYSSIFQAAYYILLFKYTNQSNIMIGNVTYGRGRNKGNNKRVIGSFANRLIHIQSVKPREQQMEFISKVNNDLMLSLKNDDVPFDELIKHHDKKNENNHLPFFQAVFNLVRDVTTPICFDGLKEQSLGINFAEAQNAESQYDIKLLIVDSRENARMQLSVRCDKKLQMLPQMLSNNYIKIVESLIEHPSKRISEIDLTGDVKNQVFNGDSLTKAYWMDQFYDSVPVLNLPSDNVRPAIRTYNGGIVERRIDKGLCSDFRSLV
ncbi:MAG: condensation domain-containing protein, partial [Cytophagales bacterium]|nr:condensation domain-containing protein [Cytophagales bacterium]